MKPNQLCFGQITASFNEVTLNSSCCWEYTKAGLDSGFVVCPVCWEARQRFDYTSSSEEIDVVKLRGLNLDVSSAVSSMAQSWPFPKLLTLPQWSQGSGSKCGLRYGVLRGRESEVSNSRLPEYSPTLPELPQYATSTHFFGPPLPEGPHSLGCVWLCTQAAQKRKHDPAGPAVISIPLQGLIGPSIGAIRGILTGLTASTEHPSAAGDLTLGWRIFMSSHCMIFHVLEAYSSVVVKLFKQYLWLRSLFSGFWALRVLVCFKIFSLKGRPSLGFRGFVLSH